MKKSIAALCLIAVPTLALANDDQGLFLGAGHAITLSIDCGTDCDSSGYAVEAGYNFNKIFAIEVKQSSTEYDEYEDDEIELTYVGVNIGHTFNSSWVRLYGKIGYVKAEDTETYYDTEYNNGSYEYISVSESYSDNGAAFGIGISFTPFAHQKGLYIKLESMSAQLFEDTMGYGQLAIGYQF